jgi:hypothetical protein
MYRMFIGKGRRMPVKIKTLKVQAQCGDDIDRTIISMIELSERHQADVSCDFNDSEVVVKFDEVVGFVSDIKEAWKAARQ